MMSSSNVPTIPCEAFQRRLCLQSLPIAGLRVPSVTDWRVAAGFITDSPQLKVGRGHIMQNLSIADT